MEIRGAAAAGPAANISNEPSVFEDLWAYLKSAGIGLLGNVAGSAVSGAITGGGLGEYAALLEMQREMQRELLTVTMLSNIERSKHEGKMAFARNIRVG
jgi:ABC-type methionine transport system permease subunit